MPNDAAPENEIASLQLTQLELAQGNIAQAEFHLRAHIAVHGDDDQSSRLLAAIARGYGLNPGFRLSERRTPAMALRPRYLLIKAWGFGFWSDMHHVMGMLLLAELTHRIPVVHWGSNSLFGNRNDRENAYTQFFEAPSAVTLEHLQAPGLGYFPPKWSRDNLHLNNINKNQGPYSRLAPQYLFLREEDVLVSDFYAAVATLIPWIGQDSRYFGMSDTEIYADLFERHLRPLPHIAQQVQTFFQKNMQGRNWVAVHARGSDKAYESPGLADINKSYFGFVDHIVKINPGIGVFLITDSVDMHDAFTDHYGEHLLTTSVLRSDNDLGVHYQQHSGLRLGEEVLMDALLALKCNYFIGNGESNVSLAISSMKRWPQGLLGLMGIIGFRGENSMLYAREPIVGAACRLCAGPTRSVFRGPVLGRHHVGYFRCSHCGSLQTEFPYWLDEAYSGDAERYDTGKASRTLSNFFLLPKLLQILQVRTTDTAVDYGGGTGLFARLMRDIGFNFYTSDKFGSGEFMGSFQWDKMNHRCQLLTLFEVAEHFSNPAGEWTQLLELQPQWIIGSTELYAGQGSDWPYLSGESGQHVFFYSAQAMALIARQGGYHYYDLGMYFLFTRQPLETAAIDQINDWQKSMYAACRNTFDQWVQAPFQCATRDNQEVNAYSRLQHSRLKIVIDGVFFRFTSGIARVWKHLLAHWAMTEFAQCLVVVDRGRTAPRHKGIRYVDAAHFDFAADDPSADRRMLQDICDSENAGLFISTYYTLPLTTPAAMLVPDMIPEILGFDLRLRQWQSKRRAIEYARAFVSISHSTQHDLVQLYPHCAQLPKSVAHCGCDFRAASGAMVDAFRHKHGITRPYFLLVGERSGPKNAQLFFEAFARLGALRSELAIVCTLADTPLTDTESSHVADAQVHLLVLSDDELQAAYSGAIALAYPSRYEGFGLPVLEAMACACPAITCRNSSIGEVGGEAVIYVEPDSVEQMMQALIDTQVPAIREQMIEAGLEQAQKFSWAHMARETGMLLAQSALAP